ncbi:MAG: ORF6N domain-containing protein [Tannerellaceae bacterium]|nr:ORF6N domain-containing protein [Tannerellaceae bacterium]
MQSNTINFKKVESKIILIREQQVILDKDVAELYGVTTKEINQAVKNNPEKFPEGYVFPLSTTEFDYLRSKFLTAKFNKTRVIPKAFTERGLYMLATILKSSSATTTTIAIIETFIKLRELTRTVSELAVTQDDDKQKTLLQKSGELFSYLIDNESLVTESETTIELNLAVLKLKHTVKRGKEKE